MLCLTLSCRSTWAPPERSSLTASVSPLRLALMRAVMPFWGTQWDKTVTITCNATHIETRWKVYTCCEVVKDTSISLAYLSTWTYKSSREEGTLLIINLMSDITVEGAQPCQHKLLIYQYKRDFQIWTSLIVDDVNHRMVPIIQYSKRAVASKAIEMHARHTLQIRTPS